MSRSIVEDDGLAIQGTIEFERYQAVRPIYTEYPIGHYRRSSRSPTALISTRSSRR